MKKSRQNIKPEWAPGDSGSEFATYVVPGLDSEQTNISPKKQSGAKAPDIAALGQGVLDKDRTVLARAITLIESNSPKHFDKAQALLRELLPYTGNSLRIGITGPPGVGKSTFIESFGVYLCKLGHRVAVLAIDPTSSLTKGSIMGDKTRMEKLAADKNAFIRPSPSGGALGGVARKTREAALLCEAAGFDIILIETVGVGQSEITVRSMVDFYILMLLPGSGDELQGIKKGVVEIADLLVVNKAEGDNLLPARLTAEQYRQALHYLQPATQGWQTDAISISALNETGIETVWNITENFLEAAKTGGVFESRRRNQTLNWFYSLAEEEIISKFYNTPGIKELTESLKSKILSGEMPSTQAVRIVTDEFFGGGNH
mgnify:CR=1 FL=1